jgi:uncharacterized Zn-finger protein
LPPPNCTGPAVFLGIILALNWSILPSRSLASSSPNNNSSVCNQSPPSSTSTHTDSIYLIKMSRSCRTCSKSFMSQRALQQHLSSPAHNHKCDYCNKSFRSQHALQQHLDSPAHVVECNYCDRSFRSKHALQQHLGSPAHVVECNYCDRSFRSPHSLQQHIDAVHDYNCLNCDRHFRTPDALHRHITDTHAHRFRISRPSYPTIPLPRSISDSVNPTLQEVKLTRPTLDIIHDEACSICIENFHIDSMVIQLLCKHWFHSECIKTWILNHTTCPQCRRKTD